MMRPIRSESGASTIVATLVLLFAFTALTIAGLSAAKSNLNVTRNYRTGTQALLAAEAAKIHAHEMISDWGVIRFTNDILPNWEEIYGDGWREMPGHPGVRYQATIEQDPDNALGNLILRTAAQAPGESMRRIEARLQIDLEFSPGAIYLPADVINPRFNGNSFLVDGHDYLMNGNPNPNGHDVPGVTTRNDDAKDAVLTQLNGQQRNNVIGDGGTPAVQRSAGPTLERIQNEIVPNILNQMTSAPRTAPYRVNANETFGTIDAPQITYFPGDLTVVANGTAQGAGIMIVDGNLKINGDMNFTGLIIARGGTEIATNPDTNLSGNAAILGALWTTNLGITVGGTASVTYSSQALELAGDLGIDLLPQRAVSVAWKEL